MRKRSVGALFGALLLLCGCSGQPAPQPSTTPAVTAPAPTPTAPPAPTAPTVDAPEDEYESYHIDQVGATILLPKSWAGNYVVESIDGSGGFTFAQKDYLSGELGIREDGTEGPIPDPDGLHVPLAYFRVEPAADFSLDPSTFSTTEPTDSLFVWLGERDGLCYTLRFPTSFSAGDSENAQQKYELYTILCRDIEAYPENASAYFLFDEEAGGPFSIDDELARLEEEAAYLENRVLTESLPQAEMTQISLDLYQLWDSELNSIWSRLKAELDPAAMETLTAQELEWIADKEAEVEKAGADVAGGTLQPMVEASRGARLTRERVYELAEYLR